MLSIGSGSKLGLEMYVFGPDTHMTAIVGMALGHRPIPKPTKPEPPMSQNLLGKNVRHISLYNVLGILLERM